MYLIRKNKYLIRKKQMFYIINGVYSYTVHYWSHMKQIKKVKIEIINLINSPITECPQVVRQADHDDHSVYPPSTELYQCSRGGNMMIAKNNKQRMTTTRFENKNLSKFPMPSNKIL